jgi:hypothetical protein
MGPSTTQVRCDLAQTPFSLRATEPLARVPLGRHSVQRRAGASAQRAERPLTETGLSMMQIAMPGLGRNGLSGFGHNAPFSVIERLVVRSRNLPFIQNAGLASRDPDQRAIRNVPDSI